MAELLKERPKSGQFVMIWKYQSEIWCDTMRWNGGILERYEERRDDFFEAKDLPTDVDYKYIVDL